MNKFPKFSIVTPSYNQVAFIAETIESVLSQEGVFEIEYVVMDGGSTDGSVEIIKQYADRMVSGDWPVKCKGISMVWVSQKDKGQSDAINQGLRQATGDILSYINSDDLYAPGAFQRVAAEFAQRPGADFIYGDGDVIDEHGDLQWEWLSRPYNHAVMTSYHFLWNDFSNYILQQATFWRKRVPDNIGYFDETFHYAMDLEYWVRAGHHHLKLHHIPYKLGKFRLIAGTKSLSSPTAFWEDQLEIYRRYRGSHKMQLFFAYYYYNIARHINFDLTKTREAGQHVFVRWNMLPGEEQQILSQQAECGFALACVLVARELQRQKQFEEADIVFKQAITKRVWLSFHPLAFGYWVKRFGGSYLSSLWDRLTGKVIETYRRVRVNYRYYQHNKHSQKV